MEHLQCSHELFSQLQLNKCLALCTMCKQICVRMLCRANGARADDVRARVGAREVDGEAQPSSAQFDPQLRLM